MGLSDRMSSWATLSSQSMNRSSFKQSELSADRKALFGQCFKSYITRLVMAQSRTSFFDGHISRFANNSRTFSLHFLSSPKRSLAIDVNSNSRTRSRDGEASLLVARSAALV